jgi:Bifunctional DNA primase/polymerase, N-terminal
MITEDTAPGPYGLAAPAYLAAGWWPIPLPPGAKWPPPVGFTGYAGRGVTQADVAFWCNGAGFNAGNIALRLPGGLDDSTAVLGLDVDAYGGKLGGETLAEAESRLGALPQSPRSSARSGDEVSGIRFYRVPSGRLWADTLGPGVEIIHHGHRYAVVWPSINPDADGAVYRWQDDRFGWPLPEGEVPATADLPELPGAWIRELDRGAVNDHQGKAGRAAAAAVLNDMPDGEPCSYLARLLDKLAGVVGNGSSRHDTTRNAVLAIVRAGEQGHHGAPAALDVAEGLLLAQRRLSDPGEFARMVEGAAATVAAEPTPDDLRGCCGENSRLAGIEINLIDETDDEDDDAGAAGDDGTNTVGVDDEPNTTGGATPPGDGPSSAGEQTDEWDQADADPEPEREFWQSRRVLAALYEFARARRVGPWAMLGAVLARAVACISPRLGLPPTIGGFASLNLFVVLCGESGSGKSAAQDAAREFLDARGGTAFLDTQPGTGEGLLAAFCYVHTEKGRPPEVRRSEISVLFDVDEVSALSALFDRKGTTLLSFLKSAWMGRGLATQNAEISRRRRVDAHSYRFAMVAGAQPVNAGAILDDEAGGFPQRFLWMPTYDPDRRDLGEDVPQPLPWRWQVPGPLAQVSPNGMITLSLEQELRLPAVAVATIRAAENARNRPIGQAPPRGSSESLSGHALLCRAKVAAVLALLDCRTDEVSEADWELAGVVMKASDQTRAAVMAARAKADRAAYDAQAARRGREAAISTEAEVEHRVVRCMAVIQRAIQRRGGEHSTNAVQKFVGTRYKHAIVREALARLVAGGKLAAREGAAANGKSATYYRAVK